MGFGIQLGGYVVSHFVGGAVCTMMQCRKRGPAQSTESVNVYWVMAELGVFEQAEGTLLKSKF